MAEIIDFPAQDGAQDSDEMTREELLALLKQVRGEIAALDAKEPKNMNSEAYENWADRHEELEDQVDEILELLEEE